MINLPSSFTFSPNPPNLTPSSPLIIACKCYVVEMIAKVHTIILIINPSLSLKEDVDELRSHLQMSEIDL